MRDFLETCIPVDDYQQCLADGPSYDQFIETVADKIGVKLDEDPIEVTCRVRADGTNRMRIDGIVLTETARFNLYVELVWLPAMESFRGKANLRELADDQEPLASEGDS